MMRSLLGQERTILRRGFSPLRRLRAPAPAGRVDVAAVCYRVRGGEPEFLLVRSRSGCWTFPKGGVEQDATAADAAAREAYEEAGVTGRVDPTPFTSYRHRKARRIVQVHAHLFQVKGLNSPLEDDRDPTWFSADKAKRRLQKDRTPEFAAEVATVIDRATKRIRLR